MCFKEWWKKKSGGKKALYIIGAVFVFLILVGIASDSDGSTMSATDGGSPLGSKKLNAEVTETYLGGMPAYQVINRNSYDWTNAQFVINDYYVCNSEPLIEADNDVYVLWANCEDTEGRAFWHINTGSVDVYELKITTDEGSASYA